MKQSLNSAKRLPYLWRLWLSLLKKFWHEMLFYWARTFRVCSRQKLPFVIKSNIIFVPLNALTLLYNLYNIKQYQEFTRYISYRTLDNNYFMLTREILWFRNFVCVRQSADNNCVISIRTWNTEIMESLLVITNNDWPRIGVFFSLDIDKLLFFIFYLNSFYSKSFFLIY